MIWFIYIPITRDGYVVLSAAALASAAEEVVPEIMR